MGRGRCDTENHPVIAQSHHMLEECYEIISIIEFKFSISHIAYSILTTQPVA